MTTPNVGVSKLSIEERDIFLDSPDYQSEGGGDGIAFYVEPVIEI